MEVCGTSWTYNPAAVTKVASSDGTAVGSSSGGEELAPSGFLVSEINFVAPSLAVYCIGSVSVLADRSSGC